MYTRVTERVHTSQQATTYEHVLELDVAVHEALTVQEADALHHVDGHLQARQPRQVGLERGVEVTLVAVHHEQHCRAAAAAVVIVDHRAAQRRHALVIRHVPAAQTHARHVSAHWRKPQVAWSRLLE